MNEYISIMNELVSNFSYYDFLDLLKRIDADVINGKIHSFNSEFLYFFNHIMSFVNDSCLVDGEYVTLGHTLVENALINKEQLTPTLAAYFYLEQKKGLGLEDYCNDINFVSHKLFKMAIHSDKNEENTYLEISWNHYQDSIQNPEKFNYEIMHDVVHELTHVYQETRSEDSDNLFDRLAFYDYKSADIIIKKLLGGTNGTNIVAHESFLSEFMADEQADVFMLQMAKNHPDYFSSDLIQIQQANYQRKKGDDFYTNPRRNFDELLEYIKKIGNSRGTDYLELILPVFAEVEEVKQKSAPLIAELQAQGISEKPTDSYYNIFLHSLYHYDGQEIHIVNEPHDKKTAL